MVGWLVGWLIALVSVTEKLVYWLVARPSLLLGSLVLDSLKCKIREFGEERKR